MHFAIIDVEHMDGMFIVELIDFPTVGLCQVRPFHLFDEHAMPQSIRLLHLVPKQVLIFWRNDMDHGSS
jgi:hypothetical protein